MMLRIFHVTVGHLYAFFWKMSIQFFYPFLSQIFFIIELYEFFIFWILTFYQTYDGLPWWLNSKESACNSGAEGDAGSIPGSGRSSGGGHSNPLQYSSWRIPWTEELGRLQSIGCKELDRTEMTEHACMQGSASP